MSQGQFEGPSYALRYQRRLNFLHETEIRKQNPGERLQKMWLCDDEAVKQKSWRSFWRKINGKPSNNKWNEQNKKRWPNCGLRLGRDLIYLWSVCVCNNRIIFKTELYKIPPRVVQLLIWLLSTDRSVNGRFWVSFSFCIFQSRFSLLYALHLPSKCHCIPTLPSKWNVFCVNSVILDLKNWFVILRNLWRVAQVM